MDYLRIINLFIAYLTVLLRVICSLRIIALSIEHVLIKVRNRSLIIRVVIQVILLSARSLIDRSSTH